MHSSTNGFPWRSHFVYWLHWKVIPKQPGINHRRLAEMPLLLSPSGQYTVCRYGGHTVRVLSFFFSSFCFLLVLYVLIPLNVGPFFFIFFFPRLQLVPSVILVCASPCIIMGGGKNSASSIADLQVSFWQFRFGLLLLEPNGSRFSSWTFSCARADEQLCRRNVWIPRDLYSVPLLL